MTLVLTALIILAALHAALIRTALFILTALLFILAVLSCAALFVLFILAALVLTVLVVLAAFMICAALFILVTVGRGLLLQCVGQLQKCCEVGDWQGAPYPGESVATVRALWRGGWWF